MMNTNMFVPFVIFITVRAVNLVSVKSQNGQHATFISRRAGVVYLPSVWLDTQLPSFCVD